MFVVSVIFVLSLTACIRIPYPQYGIWYSEEESITLFITPEMRLDPHEIWALRRPEFWGVLVQDGIEFDVVVSFGEAGLGQNHDGYIRIFKSVRDTFREVTVLFGNYRIDNGRLYITQYTGNPKASDLEIIAIFELKGGE